MTQPETTALANPIQNILPSLFPNVNFGDLDAAISSLANHNGDLTKEEKDCGVQLMDQWKTMVIQTIHTKNNFISNMLAWFDPSRSHYGYYDPNGRYDYLNRNGAFEMTLEDEARLADQTTTVELYQSYRTAVDQYMDLKDAKPEEPFFDPEVAYTAVDKLEISNAFKINETKWNNAMQKSMKVLRTRRAQWITAVRQDDNVKNMISQMVKFQRTVQSLQRDCEGKAQLAKMNIMIGNAEIRNSLREVLNFVNFI